MKMLLALAGAAVAMTGVAASTSADAARHQSRTCAKWRNHHCVSYGHGRHAQWNRGMDNPDLRFVKVNDRQLTHARLGLVQAVSDILTSGLTLIGADAPTEMR